MTKNLNIISNLLKNIISKNGLVLSRENTIRGKIDGTYLEAIWSEKLQPIFNVNISHTRDFFGFDFYIDGWHPYVQTLLQYRKLEESLSYDNSILKKYYERYQPNCTCKVFNIYEKNCPKYKLHSEENGLKEFLLPWDEFPKIDQSNKRLMYSGPMEKSRGRYELERIIEVYNSINTHGYNVKKSPNLFNSNHIQGYFLKNINEYRFIVLHGKHRISALSVLGYEKIPVTFELGKQRVIDVRLVEDWPQVRNGTYTIESALDIFYWFFNEDGNRIVNKYNIHE